MNNLWSLVFIIAGIILLFSSFRMSITLKKDKDSKRNDQTRFSPETVFIRRLIVGAGLIIAGIVLLLRDLF